MSEVRKIKLWIVIGFLLVLTLITIPYSAVFEYSLQLKIFTSIGLFLLLVVMVVFVRFDKTFLAIQTSILYSILLMLYYTQGVNTFYTYIFFYIALAVIIFYQEMYSYLIYGTIVVLVAAFYTMRFRDTLVAATDIAGSEYIFVTVLILFYIVNLIHILYNEKLYTDLNYEWVEMNHIIHNYQDDILYYLEDIRQDAQKSPIYEDLEFQKASFELSRFIAEQILKDGKEIVNLMDLYVYIHERGVDNIISNQEISVPMKKISNMLGKYLLNENTDMFSMLINFYIRFEESKGYEHDRYSYRVDDITNIREEQIIAFCLVYTYLAREIEKNKLWNQVERKDIDEEDILESVRLEEFFSPSIIAFYNDNYEMIKEYLDHVE